MNRSAISLGIALAMTTSTALASTDAEALAQQLAEQQKMIEQQAQLLQQLQQKLNEQQKELSQQQQAIEATAEVVEAKQEESSSSHWDKLHLGGYGELHYNNLNGENGASDKDEIDFHRFVLFMDYEFSDRIKFVSEVELEHSLSGDDKPGEVELEQAYIDYSINNTLTSRTGLFLLPVGLLNETHEPPTFYGVERNNVEKNIIPTTWWEAGTGLIGQFDNGLTVQGYVHSGLKTNAGKNYAIRSGRQKVAEASAEDLAFTLAANYNGVPGLSVGGSAQFQADMTQSEDPTAGHAFFAEAHATYQYQDFGLRALAAYWDLDGDGPSDVGADEQLGFYIEPSYKLSDSLGVFARYSFWDNQAGISSIESEKAQWDLGINWWLHPHVVLKADYQIQDFENDKNQDGFNLGMGYQF